MPRENFRIHKDAQKEVIDAIHWYEEQGEDLADRFVAAMSEAIDKVLASPERFSKYLFGTQYVRVNRFSYVIVYRDINELVHVVAVAHTSRRPGYWRKRLRDIEET